jgi:hypothetical protein
VWRVQKIGGHQGDVRGVHPELVDNNLATGEDINQFRSSEAYRSSEGSRFAATLDLLFGPGRREKGGPYSNNPNQRRPSLSRWVDWQVDLSEFGAFGWCDRKRRTRLGADDEYDGVIFLCDRRSSCGNVANAHERAGRSVNRRAVNFESCSAGVDEVQLLVLLVLRICVVVFADDAITGSSCGVAVDAECRDPEVVANRMPARIGMGDRGCRHFCEHAVDGHESASVIGGNIEWLDTGAYLEVERQPAASRLAELDFVVRHLLHRLLRDLHPNETNGPMSGSKLSPRIDHCPAWPHGMEVFDSEAHTGFEPVLPP